MPEDIKLYPTLTTEEFINFVGTEEQLIEKLTIYKMWRKKIKELSKGYTQRLKIYSALFPKRKIVLLDEPFEGFDPLQLQNISEIIRNEEERGRTFIISAHQLNYAQEICNYFILLKDGKVVDIGTFEKLKKKYNKDFLEKIFIEALR